ncbi:MAG TPA: hypothetical protein VJ602_07685 [Paludibacter sp.]|nr:hypothetical protein [Paludibacter sp.]
MKSLFRYFLLAPLLALSVASCNDNVVSSIPDYPVNLELNLTSTYPTFRNSHNQSLTFLKGITITDRIGYGGILVYTSFDGTYYAFDMACPYEAKPTVRVYPNNLGQAVCEKCGSVFNLGYGLGDPQSGPAKEILKRYRATLSGDILYVSR